MNFFEVPDSRAWFLENTGSTIAEALAKFHHEIFGLLLIIFTSISIFIFLLYYRFVFKWNSRGRKNIFLYRKNYFNLNITEHPVLEVVWTILPAVFLYSIIVPSLLLLYLLDGIAEPEITIRVIAHQWYWTYEIDRPHVPGRSKKILLETLGKESSAFTLETSIDSYLIPTSELSQGAFRNLEVDKPLILPAFVQIRFLVTSDDVIHSFSLPVLGMKIDAVPGRLSSGNAWLRRNLVAFGQCSELCGSGHAQMPIKIIVK